LIQQFLDTYLVVSK